MLINLSHSLKILWPKALNFLTVKYKNDYGQVFPKAEEPTIIKDHLPSQDTETKNTE